MRTRAIVFAMIFLFTLTIYGKDNSCITCHNDLDEEFVAGFIKSTHYKQGILCHDCHGGNPAEEDMERSMSPKAGFKGKIPRKTIPTFCDRCHGDIEYMRNFNPSMRVDQYREYLTSIHGKLFKKGDKNVAVCTDCHTSHRIIPPNDLESSIHPANVAETCGECHNNSALMQSYGINANQYHLYKESIHAKMIYENKDYSAPTCNDCHGNHGAIPPGIRNIAEVCGQCHVLQAEFYEGSFHSDIFENIGEPGCETCHSNHKIKQLTDEHLLNPDSSVCSTCHEDGDAGYSENQKIAIIIAHLDSSYNVLLNKIENQEHSGISTEQARFDVQQLKEVLVKLRVAVHGMSVKKLEPLQKEGLKVIEKVSKNIELKQQDYINRKRGLYFSIILILLTVIGIYFYIKFTYGEHT